MLQSQARIRELEAELIQAHSHIVLLTGLTKSNGPPTDPALADPPAIEFPSHPTDSNQNPSSAAPQSDPEPARPDLQTHSSGPRVLTPDSEIPAAGLSAAPANTKESLMEMVKELTNINNGLRLTVDALKQETKALRNDLYNVS